MLQIIDFLDRLLLKPKDMSLFYLALKNKLSGTLIYENKPSTPLDFCKKAYFFHDIPDYITPEFNTTNKHIKLIAIDTYKGSRVTLSNYKNLNQYLSQNFSGKKRGQFKTYKKRLEKCFNISYKVYHGNIDKEEYDRLFAKFPEMIKKRFDLLGTEHYDLTVWDRYDQNGFSLINEKKACLFVIYDGDNPISIALNPILGTVIYGYVRAFDVDYSKFYLGFVDLVFQLEWCFANNIEIFDLLKGFFSYKSKFTTSTYYFQNHIVYNTRSLASTAVALKKAFKIKSFYTVIKILKLIHIDTIYHNYSNKKLDQEKAKKFGENKTEFNYTIAPLAASTGIEKYFEPIDINAEAYSFLKKPTYDTLYTSQEHIAKIEVYKENKNSYIIKGVKTSYRITYA